MLTNLMKHIFILFLFQLSIFKMYAQCKSFFIGVNGDTLNCIDYKNKKDGKWINTIKEVRGEPGYEEEGNYVNGKKEGLWKRYSLEGDKLAEEYYRWGVKDGPSRFFKGIDEVLVREETWIALDPARIGEKIRVPDPKDPSGRKYIIKTITDEGVALRNGEWRYFDYETRRLVKTEMYYMDSMVQPTTKKPINPGDKKDPKKTEKTKVILEFEKSKKGKKNKYTDGGTGG
jgi:hypothetical protein